MQTLSLKSLIKEYANSHQNPVNIKYHNICVPAIMWSFLGALSVVKINDNIGAAHIFILLAAFYYLRFKNLKLSLIMLAVPALMLWSFNFITHPLWTSIAVFVLAWIGQFYGHHVEKKRPSFTKDLQFFLIGPIWVLEKISPKILNLK
jgi:uncharacterized membrane protein YGL010W